MDGHKYIFVIVGVIVGIVITLFVTKTPVLLGIIGVMVGGLITASANWFLEKEKYKRETRTYFRNQRIELYEKMIEILIFFYDNLTSIRSGFAMKGKGQIEKQYEEYNEFWHKYNKIKNKLALFCEKEQREIVINFYNKYIDNDKIIKEAEIDEIIKLLQDDVKA